MPCHALCTMCVWRWPCHAMPCLVCVCVCVCGGGICAARAHLANLANAPGSCTWPHPGRCQGRPKHMRPVLPKVYVLSVIDLALERAEQGCQ